MGGVLRPPPVALGGEADSSAYAQKCQRTARYSLEYLGGLKMLNLPRNLADRSMRFKVSPGAVVTFTKEEVRAILTAAQGQLHPNFIIMINCGFTQGDIVGLKQDEVDWTAGTITRRRSKTGHRENVPTVIYRLWPETFAELKRWRSEDPDLALVTRSGRPWVNRRFKDSDQIRQNYDRLSARLGIAKTLEHLRKTSASLLHNSEWSRYVHLFLGQSERTVAGRHYTAHDQAKFDRAVAWLRTQYDLA